MSGINLFNRITNRDDNSINLYFKDVSRYPLLTPEEEKDLAIKYQEISKELKTLESLNPYKKQLQVQLLNIQNKLVVSNLRFVITVAKQYQNKGVPLVDLIQSGNEGLIESIKHFKPEKGFRFMSYAIWWVRQNIVQTLSNTSRMIRVPYTKATNLHKIIVASGKYEQEYGEEPTLEQLSKLTKLSVKEIQKILDAPKPTVSLETPFTSDPDAGSLIDVTPNKSSKLSDDNLKQEDLNHVVNMMLNKLDDRTHDILLMYFGLNGVDKMSLKDIGDRFNFTEERARQIKKKALSTFKDRYSKTLKENGFI